MTKIEWVRNSDGSQGETWNPFAGCSILSPGCTNCYAMKMARRIEACNAGLPAGHGGAPHYAGTTRIVNGNAVWTGKVGIASDEVLLKPLMRKKPTTWFVNSMSDLFHENVPDEAIDKVFAVMALTPQHTYQVLTKRSARMRGYFEFFNTHCRVAHHANILAGAPLEMPGPVQWPLPNVWLGVSTERQKEADERIPDLLATPAAVRFISAEPLLGPISLRWAKWDDWKDGDGQRRSRVDHLDGARMLDWVIVGGESGPGARPMHPDWARAIRDQCAAAGVPFFFKQWGSFFPIIDRDNDDPDWRRDYRCTNHNPGKFKILNLAGGCGFHGERVHLMQRYSKVHAGRLLDGVTYDAMPAARAEQLSTCQRPEGMR